MAQNNHLLQIVRSGHPHLVPLGDGVGGFFNIGVRRLRLFGIDHIDVVIFAHFPQVAGHLVGVENQNHLTAPVALIIAEQIHQQLAGGIQALLGQVFQLVPGENDIVAVHQQKLLPVGVGPLPQRGRGFFRRRLLFFPPGLGRRVKIPPADGAVGPFIDSHQLLVLLQRAGISLPPDRLGRRFRLRRRFLWFLFGQALSVQAAFHMHIVRHLVPFDGESGAVGAEHRIRGVFQIPLRVVARLLHNLLLVVAGQIALQAVGKPGFSLGVSRRLAGVIPHAGGGGQARQQRPLSPAFRRVESAPHLLDIRHGPAQVDGGQLQAKFIPGLQQQASGLHQPLAHRPVDGLAQVASLRVLDAGPPSDQGDFHICDGRAGEDAQVNLFLQMAEGLALPAPVQQLFGAVRVELQPRAPLRRLQQQVDFGIMAQRLKMAHPFHRVFNGLPIGHGAGSEFQGQAKAL